MAVIFKKMPSGFEYQESWGGHDLDEITRVFEERIEEVVQ
jgi:hypothetical protein